jgi:hypothetical protein
MSWHEGCVAGCMLQYINLLQLRSVGKVGHKRTCKRNINEQEKWKCTNCHKTALNKNLSYAFKFSKGERNGTGNAIGDEPRTKAIIVKS